MRTTVSIDDQLLVEVKTLAARTGKTLSAMVEDALRQSLAKRGSARSVPLPLLTHDGGGLQPGVDLDDTSALLDLMDGLND
jgi:hypothetical protein